MQRSAVNRILRQMEALRHDAMEADTKSEERRLDAEYDRLWAAIEPYVSGKRPYTPEDGQVIATPEAGQSVTTREG